jgi:hypothetical protein
VGLHVLAGDREAQARAARLGGEEGVEDLRADLLRDAGDGGSGKRPSFSPPAARWPSSSLSWGRNFLDDTYDAITLVASERFCDGNG